jgi:hypothetical protein
MHSYNKLSFIGRDEMMRRWFCMDCRTKVGLDKHGRCEHCDSEAVDLVETPSELTDSVSAPQDAPPIFLASA